MNTIINDIVLKWNALPTFRRSVLSPLSRMFETLEYTAHIFKMP
jgi:hypothetical protein